MRRALFVPLLALAACSADKRAPRSPSKEAEPQQTSPQTPMPEGATTGGDSEGKPSDQPAAPPPPTTSAPAGGSPAPTPAPKTPSAAPGTAGKAMVNPGELVQAQVTFDDATKAFSAAGSDCLHLCKALGSMQNATNHLCELVAGTADQKRCSDAKAKLESAQAKVKSTCGNSCG